MISAFTKGFYSVYSCINTTPMTRPPGTPSPAQRQRQRLPPPNDYDGGAVVVTLKTNNHSGDGRQLADDQLADEMDEFGHTGLDQVVEDEVASGDEDALGPEVDDTF